MACALQSLRAPKLSFPYACTAVVALRQTKLREILGQNNELRACQCVRSSRAACSLRRLCRLALARARAGLWGACTPSRVATRPKRSRHAAYSRPWLGNPHISTLSSSLSQLREGI